MKVLNNLTTFVLFLLRYKSLIFCKTDVTVIKEWVKKEWTVKLRDWDWEWVRGGGVWCSEDWCQGLSAWSTAPATTSHPAYSSLILWYVSVELSLTNQIISNIIFFAVQIINHENKCKFKVRFKVFFSDFLNYKALVPVEHYKMLQTFESFGHNSLLSSLEQYWPVAGWVSLQHSLGIYPQAELSWVCRPSPPFKLPSAKILEHVQSSPNTQD